MNSKNITNLPSKITVELLKSWDACKDGIDFFTRNNLDQLDYSTVQVEGDFKEFWSWLKEQGKYKREYDERGNLIKVISPNGYELRYEYDERGNLTKKIYPNGNEYKYEYLFDDMGVLTEIKQNGKTICKIIK